MDLSKIPEIVALTIENSKFTWIDFCLFFFFFFKQRKRETAPNHRNVIYFKVFGAVQVILSAFQSLKTASDKTSAINKRVETTGRSRHRHFGVGQNR